jgi:serine/threonine-protein kinase RsbW
MVIARAKLEELANMMSFVRQEISKVKFSKADRRRIEIALEEALVNIIHHAYPDSEGSIEILSKCESDAITFTIIDEGIPFNPLLEKPKDQAGMSLEERQEGGLGIFLMCSLLDTVQYHRSPTHNTLTLTKKK